ncbi:enoyl-CoA hydratase-related protein [Nocardioides convexus]|uniref:enoyl-CoA hydratase-related protein n=1 Tax=Nocardioides convexus TaxID=2712224 RepID=UPI0024183756|nr:enoyl-CoA hydratase-related protein [Nocardioides convexus]
MVQTTKENAGDVFAQCESIKQALRRLELFPKPVVAAINGAALGGGYEITLATQHRILVNDPKIKVGLPEATLGLLPGGGGVTRAVRKWGLQTALMDVLLQGTQFNPETALKKGVVDDLVATQDEPDPRREGVDQGQPRGCPLAVGRPRLQDARRHPEEPGPRRLPPGLPGAPAQADSRERTTPPRGRSSRPRSRARRSTSTPPRGSSRATWPTSWSTRARRT